MLEMLQEENNQEKTIQMLISKYFNFSKLALNLKLKFKTPE